MKERFDISIDHSMMRGAKEAFNACMRKAVARAIGTGADEGSATLRISFEIMTTVDKDTGELIRVPIWKYKAGFSVPMKESLDATIPESSRLIQGKDGWRLVNGQISMDELMEDDRPEEYPGQKWLAEVR